MYFPIQISMYNEASSNSEIKQLPANSLGFFFFF